MIAVEDMERWRMDGLLGWMKTHYDPGTLFWAWGGFNTGATLAYLALTPVATFLPGYLVAAALAAARGPWFPLDLPSMLNGIIGWKRIALFAFFGFVPILVFDFFITGFIACSMRARGCGCSTSSTTLMRP